MLPILISCLIVSAPECLLVLNVYSFPRLYVFLSFTIPTRVTGWIWCTASLMSWFVPESRAHQFARDGVCRLHGDYGAIEPRVLIPVNKVVTLLCFTQSRGLQFVAIGESRLLSLSTAERLVQARPPLTISGRSFRVTALMTGELLRCILLHSRIEVHAPLSRACLSFVLPITGFLCQGLPPPCHRA
jgi:hypothetical protein